MGRIVDSNIVFAVILVVFVVSLGGVVYIRGGKDLKVDLFGVEQVLHNKSPYDNPTDLRRPLFRYAPAFALLMYPFLLKSKEVAPFEFKDIELSVMSWYLVNIIFLLIIGVLLFKIIGCVSMKRSIRNLKIAFLMSCPLIGYELSNGQNKLCALLFLLLAIYLFERDKIFWSAVFFNLSLVVYIPLLSFIVYFILRKRRGYLLNFILASLIVFFLFPSLILGFRENFYLLKEWVLRCLKPFLITNSYATYIDLRNSSQSLPSTIGKLFVTGKTGHFVYYISPFILHLIIHLSLGIIFLFSFLALWKPYKDQARGLQTSVLLILSMIVPAYCIYYTWSYLLVIYFAVLNYLSYPYVSESDRKLLLTLISIVFIATWGIGIRVLTHFSFLFWATLLLWAGIVYVLLKDKELSSILRVS